MTERLLATQPQSQAPDLLGGVATPGQNGWRLNGCITPSGITRAMLRQTESSVQMEDIDSTVTHDLLVYSRLSNGRQVTFEVHREQFNRLTNGGLFPVAVGCGRLCLRYTIEESGAVRQFTANTPRSVYVDTFRELIVPQLRKGKLFAYYLECLRNPYQEEDVFAEPNSKVYAQAKAMVHEPGHGLISPAACEAFEAYDGPTFVRQAPPQSEYGLPAPLIW